MCIIEDCEKIFVYVREFEEWMISICSHQKENEVKKNNF